MSRKSWVPALVAVVLSVGVLNGQAVLPSATVTLPADITCLSAIRPAAGGGQTPIVAAGLADGQIAIWNGRDATVTLSTPHTSRVLAVGAAGAVVLSLADDGSLARTPLAAGGAATSQHLDLGTAPTRAAEFSSDGALLVTGGGFGEIRVFDTASGVLKQQIRGHRTELQALALRPGSSTLASASAEADLRIWDVATGRAVADIPGDLSLFALAFNPSDGALASGGADRRVTLGSPATFKAMQQVALKAPKLVATLAWSPDGRLIALGDLDDETLSKGGIQILDASTRQVVGTLDTTGIAVRALAFPNQTTVVAIVGRTLRAWSVQQSTQIDPVRVSPDRPL
jgi:WD40 repeat protein